MELAITSELDQGYCCMIELAMELECWLIIMTAPFSLIPEMQLKMLRRPEFCIICCFAGDF
jgi:hypothetical protein